MDYLLLVYQRNIVAAIIAIGLYLASCVVSVSYAADNTQYEIGESLHNESAAKSVSGSYKEIYWEDLSPKDWDPLAAVKGLDLEKLDDKDPRAVEAMIAVGEAWKNAPVVPAMNGQPIRISGFVVPLDINKEKVKSFLLVPYFGACIHIPPPPGNQTIHAINAKIQSKQQNDILKDAALVQGPMTITGILETTQSNTEMGAASYQIQIDLIEKYDERQD